QGKESLRGPQRRRGRTRARALQADFTQVEFGGAEIGIRGIVLVQAADARIAKKHTAAAIRLQAMLVGINDDGVYFRDGGERGLRVLCQIPRQREVAAVSGIGMNAETMLLAKREYSRQR